MLAEFGRIRFKFELSCRIAFADISDVAHRVGRKETQFIASLFEVPREFEQASLDEFLKGIVHRSAEWFGATTVSLFLREGCRNVLHLAATSGSASTIPKQAQIVIGEGIGGIAAEDGAPVLINEVSGTEETRGKKLVSSMVVPLISSSAGCVGVLNLSRKVGLERFSHADLKLARSVASHMALAIENARLVANLRAAIDQAESERAKFRGIFEGLGLAAFLLNALGDIVEANDRAKEEIDLPLERLREEFDRRGISDRSSLEFVDEQSGRSWHAVLSPHPGGMATVVLEETTEREQHRREMDRLNRLAEIGQMTAAIAHEIRNPLTGIRSAAQMIVQVPESTEEFASIIEHEAIKLSELCNEFLSFAKPLELRLRSINFGELISRVAKLMEPQFSAKGVLLSVEIDVNLPTIDGDPPRWEQVLQNLMLNALEASEAGGQVRIGASPLGFWVEDAGCGMEETQVARLFTPFFTTKAKGTGLGLSTVKKIVDAHGASITVHSNTGKGTRFEVSFGVRRAA